MLGFFLPSEHTPSFFFFLTKPQWHHINLTPAAAAVGRAWGRAWGQESPGGPTPEAGARPRDTRLPGALLAHASQPSP